MRRRSATDTFLAANPYVRHARNLLRNGDGIIAQRGASIAAVADDAYCADGWVFLAESSGAADFAKDTTNIPGTGARSSMSLTTATANEKFGLFQPIEQSETWPFIDANGQLHLSLSFQYQMGVGDGFASIYGAIVSWASTADAVTSDIVGTWEDSATVPTLAANWAYEGSVTGTPSSSWQTAYLHGIPVNTASVNNIGVFIWHNDTASVGATDVLRITNVMLNEGKRCAPFEKRHIQQELALCQRYFYSSYNNGTAPGTATSVGRFEIPGARSIDYGANQGVANVRFPVSMRTTPVGTVYSPDSGASGHAFEFGVADRNADAINEGADGMTVQVTEDPGTNPLSFHATATAEL